MAKIGASFDDKTKLLMNESISIDENQLEDYVLVFRNPFDVGSYTASKLNKKMLSKKVEHKFLHLFHLSDDDPIIEEALISIRQLCENSSTVLLKDLSKIVIDVIIQILQANLGLLVKPYLSGDKDQIFVLIKASDHNLKVQADLIDYKVQFNEEAAEVSKNPVLRFQKVLPYAPFEKSEGGRSKNKKISQKRDSEKLYRTYDSEGNPASEGEFFRFNDRIRIVHSMLKSTMELGQLISLDILEAEFPLHSSPSLNELKRNWASFGKIFKSQPIEKIRNYFGEEVSLYFSWLGFYSKWLCIPSFFGTIIYIIIYSTGGYDFHYSTVSICLMLFSLLLSISSTFLEQLWLRKENTLAWEWGVSGLEDNDDQRPEFRGKPGVDEISGKRKKIYVPKGLEKYARFMGYWIILFFVGIVIAAITAIFLFRDKTKYAWGPTVAGIVNAIQIKILNYIYRIVARKMTDWENLETNRDYMDSLTFKLFCFQFVNSYASLFYIAFLKGSSNHGCSDGDCLGELRLQLATIYLTNLFLNILELGIPLIRDKYRLIREERRAEANGKIMTKEEKEATREDYDAPLDDYMEVVIAYGYVILFGVSFPIVPLFALILSLIEIRVDAWKLCNLTRRTFPSQAKSIGIWNNIIQIISYVGASVNIGIVLFTANAFNIEDVAYKWILFLVIEHGIFVFKLLIEDWIPDVPGVVQKGLAWSERIVSEKLYGKVADIREVMELHSLSFRPVDEDKEVMVEDIIPLVSK